jgi:hypothetical protein
MQTLCGTCTPHPEPLALQPRLSVCQCSGSKAAVAGCGADILLVRGYTSVGRIQYCSRDGREMGFARWRSTLRCDWGGGFRCCAANGYGVYMDTKHWDVIFCGLMGPIVICCIVPITIKYSNRGTAVYRALQVIRPRTTLW